MALLTPDMEPLLRLGRSMDRKINTPSKRRLPFQFDTVPEPRYGTGELLRDVVSSKWVDGG